MGRYQQLHAAVAACTLFLTIFTTFCAAAMHENNFKLGIENISQALLHALKSGASGAQRIGLICNQTAVNRQGERTVDILQNFGLRICYILAPEHGFDGKIPAGMPVSHGIDRKTGIPIESLYRSDTDTKISGKQINPELLQKIDLLMYDLQDAGMRHYTYISTLFLALQAAVQHQKPVIVLDRPNLLGPIMEGPIPDMQDSSLQSLLTVAPIPVRHGMTVGELARYFNKQLLSNKVQLQVVPMKNYYRTLETKLLAPLSPKLATNTAVKAYSFLGLLGEVIPICTGGGTNTPFELLMLPDTVRFAAWQWVQLQGLLKKYGVLSEQYSCIAHRKLLSGLKLQIPSVQALHAFDLQCALLAFFDKQGVSLQFSPVFDKAIGTAQLRLALEKKQPMAELKAQIKQALGCFAAQAASCYLYEPQPQWQ